MQSASDISGETIATNPVPPGQSIAASVMRVAAFVALAKLLSALREISVAHQFGTGAVADSYNVAISVGLWFPMTIAAAAGAALVPALVRAAYLSPPERERFVAELNGASALLATVALAVGLLMALAAPMFFGGAPNSRSQASAISTMLVLLAPYAATTVLFYYGSFRLQARGSYAYTVVEALPALAVTAALLSLGAEDGILTLGLSTLAGGVLQVVVLIVMIRGMGDRVGPANFGHRSDQWRGLYTSIGAMAFGQVLLSTAVPIDQYFAVQAGPGTPAAYGYANRLIGLGTSLGTIVLARALLSNVAATHRTDPSQAWRATAAWAVYSFLGGLLALVLGLYLATPVTSLLFERGAFDTASTSDVAELLRVGLMQLPFYLSGVVIVQWLAATGRFGTIALIAAGTIAIKLVFLASVGAKLGGVGLMLSTAVMYLFAWTAQVVVFIFKKPGSRYGGPVRLGG